MTHVDENGVLWVIPEPPGRCSECGSIEETRPYGKNGAQVCFACGMKDEKEVERQFLKRLRGNAEHPASPEERET